MPPIDIELLLKKRMGLDVASVGRPSIERAVARRMTECGATKPEEYAGIVAGSETELQELIEAVVVPETWFFRDRDAFPALAQMVITQWLPANPNGTVRLLSIPCSTCEEPYSIAMAMGDAGFPMERVHIDAVDISAASLHSAEAGIYRKNSFRGDSLEFRNRHFTEGRDGYHIRKNIQRHVHFRRGNLLDESFLAGNAPYDFMFCRNLLIYFDEETQNRAVNLLTRLLSERGVLFIGPSESGLFLRPLAAALPAKTLTFKPSLRKPSVLSQSAPAPAAAKRSLLHTAAQLADEGRLAEAAQFCEEHLREHGSSTQAYYLLGLVRDNAGQPEEARKFYRKVLFLDPGHYEALLHFGFLARKCGDESEARALLERARRVNKKMSGRQNAEFIT